jgi:DNA-binding NarL/FixJ family response regulator
MPDERTQTSSADGPATESHVPRAALASNQTLLRLIIADDDPVVASMLSLSLGREFDVVGVAGDGEATVTLAAETKPDAAIIDVDMPKGGGMAAVRGIREASPQTAMVILSGDESDQVVRELMTAGAVAYRRKGVDTQVLAESLRDAVSAHAVERQFTTAHAASGRGEASNGTG